MNWLQLARHAAPLRQRLQMRRRRFFDTNIGLWQARYERWKGVGYGGDHHLFQRRIRWSGWNWENLMATLGDDAWLDPDDPLPNWTRTAKRILDATDRKRFEPFLRAAQVDWDGAAVRTNARTQLESGLVDRVAELAGSVTGPDDDRPWSEIFTEFPVLARLLAQAVDDWADGVRSFLLRCQQDASDVAAYFGGGPPGAVRAVLSGLSDIHAGQGVLGVEFDSGLRLMYKPRPVGVEVGYGRLIGWLNDQGITPALRAVRTLDRGGYGWAEYVAPQSCQDQSAAERYHVRAGMLLALLHLLRGVDFHRENVVAAGEYPVPVDLEGLLHHEVHDNAQLPEETAVNQLLSRTLQASVLRTGLPPRWHFRDHERTALDYSPLAEWQDDGGPTPAHVPTIDGRRVSALGFRDLLAFGFDRMAGFLTARREGLPEQLRRLFEEQVRFIFRPTRIYASLLQNARQPEGLRDGLAFGFEIDRLARAYLSTSKRPPSWPLLEAELDALERGHIPHFTVTALSNALKTSDGTEVSGYLRRPSCEDCLEVLARWDEAETGRQVSILRGALDCHAVAKPATPVRSDVPSPAPTTDHLIGEAMRIAETVRQAAVWGADGSAKLPGPMYVGNARRFQLLPLLDEFFGGAAGVAVFLAALDRTANDQRHAQLIEGLTEPVRVFLRRRTPDAVRRFFWRGVGAGRGAAGLIYAFVWLARLTGRSCYRQEAEQMASLLTPAVLLAEDDRGVFGGMAGAVLGLLTLQGREWVKRAIVAGERLLITTDDRLGFAHGAAGVSLALARLAAATEQKRFADGAEAAVRAEVGWQSLAGGGWFDGLAGVGLARLGCLIVGRWATRFEAVLRSDAEVAVRATMDTGPVSIDTLADGNAARIELQSAFGQGTSALVSSMLQASRTGYRYPGLPIGRESHSLFQGSAGIGLTYLRLSGRADLPNPALFC